MGDEKRQAFTVRLDPEQHEWVRRQAFERHVSMQKIIEEALDVLRNQQPAGSPAPRASVHLATPTTAW
jgi:hypothetical protein